MKCSVVSRLTVVTVIWPPAETASQDTVAAQFASHGAPTVRMTIIADLI